jgi:hypothetical protein
MAGLTPAIFPETEAKQARSARISLKNMSATCSNLLNNRWTYWPRAQQRQRRKQRSLLQVQKYILGRMSAEFSRKRCSQGNYSNNCIQQPQEFSSWQQRYLELLVCLSLGLGQEQRLRRQRGVGREQRMRDAYRIILIEAVDGFRVMCVLEFC